jgi:hypothetical protein
LINLEFISTCGYPVFQKGFVEEIFLSPIYVLGRILNGFLLFLFLALLGFELRA